MSIAVFWPNFTEPFLRAPNYEIITNSMDMFLTQFLNYGRNSLLLLNYSNEPVGPIKGPFIFNFEEWQSLCDDFLNVYLVSIGLYVSVSHCCTTILGEVYRTAITNVYNM